MQNTIPIKNAIQQAIVNSTGKVFIVSLIKSEFKESLFAKKIDTAIYFTLKKIVAIKKKILLINIFFITVFPSILF